MRVCLLWLLYLLSSGGVCEFRACLGQTSGRGWARWARAPICLVVRRGRFRCGSGWVGLGVGRIGVFRAGPVGFWWGLQFISFLAFSRTPWTDRFRRVLQVNLSVRAKSQTKRKSAGGAASGPGGGDFGLSYSFLACWGLGRGCVGPMLGTHVFVVVASRCWCVLDSACAFQVGFGRAWGGVWTGLARAPVCCLLRRSESSSALDALPSEHDKYGFSPNGPKGFLVGLLFQLSLGFTDNSQLMRHCHIYIYIHMYIHLSLYIYIYLHLSFSIHIWPFIRNPPYSFISD